MNRKMLLSDRELEKGEFIEQRKAKAFYTVKGDPRLLIMKCLDIVTSDNGEESEVIPGKGALNNDISCTLFELLQGQYTNKRHNVPIKTHFIKRSEGDPTECIVERMAQTIPLEVIIRNQAYGSFARTYGVAEGTKFEHPTFELTLKDDARNDPIIPWDHVWATGIAEEIELQRMYDVALAVNRILIAFFQQIDIDLIDLKLVFGRNIDQKGDPTALRIIGEVSPDTCRLRDRKTGKCLDKDIFRHGLPGLKEAYAAVSQKMAVHRNQEEQAKHAALMADQYGNLPK